MASPFRYDEAFSRNIGWLTHAEQARLKHKRVAIAGLGGVGGSHLITLTRLGVGAFSLAEFDRFELANFNRQAGAATSTLGESKLEIMVAQALDINPELSIRKFPDGVTEVNIGQFLDGVDIYIDGLDFFAFDIRQFVFERCASLGIPAITVAPLGMGAALLTFMPSGISFEEYFRLRQAKTLEDKALRFLLGLSPAMPHATYLVDRSTAKLERQRGPSTGIACQICSGVAAAEALKLLLGRGKVVAAPRGVHFDAYRNKLSTTWRPGGNSNPIQRVSIWLARHMLRQDATKLTAITPSSPLPRFDVRTHENLPKELISTLVQSAIQAPSADNHHYVRFEPTSRGLRIWASREYIECLEYHKRVLIQVGYGALLENLFLKASSLGYKLEMQALTDPARQIAHLTLAERIDATSPAELALADMIPFRHTNRRFYQRRAALPFYLDTLAHDASKVPGVALLWLNDEARSAALRLVWQAESERFRVHDLHRELFSAVRFDAGWGKTCEEGLPPGSLEVEPGLRTAFKALRNWKLMRVLTRLGVHQVLGLRAAWLPCKLAPHLGVIVTEGDVDATAVNAGRAFERVWLRATSFGMALQPLAASAILTLQSSEQGVSDLLKQDLANGWANIVGKRTPLILFRLGYAQAPTQVTTRLPVSSYLTN